MPGKSPDAFVQRGVRMSASAATIADDLLDRTVLASWSRLGHTLRAPHWRADLPRMDGKVVLVTGATSGLGMAVVQGFARLGATVWMLSRDQARGQRTRARMIAQGGRQDIRLGVCDLSDLDSVRRFATEIADASPGLDVLVHNAGVLTEKRRLSPDGIELTLATNVVGPFLLTRLLIPLLGASAPARVLSVCSGGMYLQRLQLDDLQSSVGHFRGPAAYARSKRIELILTEMWAQRLGPAGVIFQAMHPGWVDTRHLRESQPTLHRLTRGALRSPEQGADTILWLGSRSRALRHPGSFWFDRARRPTHMLPWTRETLGERRRLWGEVERLSMSAQQVVIPW